jgi:hypothetical protein
MVPACGWDGLFLTSRGFNPTDPKHAEITGTATPEAAITVMSKNDQIIATGSASESGTFTVKLPQTEDGVSLRVLSQAGAYTAKTIVPSAPVGQSTDVGTLDATSTAIAQLASYEVLQQAGSTFRATPPPALAGLIAAMRTSPTADLQALTMLVGSILSQAMTEQVMDAPFDVARFELSEAYVIEAMLGEDLITQYKTALATAASGYHLDIKCDPARLNVMFAVDTTGRGLDGNGAPQLIRQGLKAGHVFLGFTSDESSPVVDDSIPRTLPPNDSRYTMTDDGQNGDELAGDGIFTIVVSLPRGARIQYKYTDGAAGDGFTGTEEWPGNSRILLVEDVLTGRPDGEPDCLVIRRDSFGDESSNKNFVNLNNKAKASGGTVSFDADLGGDEVPLGPHGVRVGGLALEAIRHEPPLTPLGVPEARENGVCSVCPAPLVLDPNDTTPPTLARADRLSIDHVRVRFSKPLNADDAKSVDHYAYFDASGAGVPIFSATQQGADVILVVQPTHPRDPATITVVNVRDASVHANVLDRATVAVGPDQTPPQVLSVRALSILDVDPSAHVDDPTVGDIVEISLDERPESSAATDPSRYRIDGLEVLAAALVDDDPSMSATPPVAPVFKVRLVTETQVKGMPYTVKLSGVRDPAGNALDQQASFEGFALYHVTFGVVTGFAYADPTGDTRGTPRGEKMYLTGTPLSSARGLDGRDVSVTAQGQTRTDVTGWPQFEMKPEGMMYQGQPVHRISLLLPKGSWSWKPAHGIEGEYARPPLTLEKVYKTLATTNDATGVRIDPVTMIAANGIDYSGARDPNHHRAQLSSTGDEPPRISVIFKREAPDEVCEVSSDVECPFIVVGAWRDLVLDRNGHTMDYDDGVVSLPPYHPTLPDYAPPKLLDARARDSFSMLLSFDKAIADPSTSLTVSVARADNQYGVPVSVLGPMDIKPHQAVVRVMSDGCDVGLGSGIAYSVSYAGETDLDGHADAKTRTQTLVAPDGCVPFTPLVDRSPPRIASVLATDLTEITVRFNKRIDPATVSSTAAYSVRGHTGAPLNISSAAVQPDRASVVLETDPQQILEPYTLTATGIADATDPPNVLTSTSVSFVGFGDRIPPNVIRARAVSETEVIVRFDKALEPVTAADASKYTVGGLSVIGATFAGDPARRMLAFNPTLAPRLRDAVLLTTSTMAAGMSYMLKVAGVHDLSGNSAMSAVSFAGVSAPPMVDVVLEYVISDTVKVAGTVPARAISMADLTNSREGVFTLGARTQPDNTPVPGMVGPVNDALGGFGMEGQPISGLARPLHDDGVAPDRVAGDGIFTILIPQVPLGTTMIWKAFASYTVAYKDANPDDPFAAFADPLPGPSVFADGQEYPGNEDGAILYDEGAMSGTVRIQCLFGDEVTYKKNTGQPAFIWITNDRSFTDR